jgi:hypothetical protein
MDIARFFGTTKTEVLEYYSWNLIFLATNVACLFFIGVIQALSSPKEEDWLQRNKRQYP